MYSLGKKRLEEEQLEPEKKTLSEVDSIKKAKEELEGLLKELEEYKNIPRDRLYLIDSKWIGSLTNTLDSVAKGYSVMLEKNLAELESIKNGSEETFQSAAKALVESTGSMASDMEEIKIVLNQIYRRFMENAEKERLVLDLLIQELNR